LKNVADRVLTGDLNIPRESSMTLLRDIIMAGRKKLEQILNAFADCMDASIPKYLCAPCSNCKGQFRDMLAYYDLWEKHGILYGGLVELIVNAMVDAKPGFIEWEWH
jgi:hypothetical protein